MSQIGGPIQAGLAGTSGTQESTGRAQAKRDRQRTETARRFQDALDLTVAGVEAAEAIHKLDENDEQDDAQRKKKRAKDDAADHVPPVADRHPGTGSGEHIDLTG